MVAVGVLSPAEAVRAVADQWNVLLFFLGLMMTAVVAEQSGVLALLTGAAFGAAGGRQTVLFAIVCVLCVGVTAALSNDATILLLTPLILSGAASVGAPVLPYAFACAYLANASSLLLPIANPANIIVLEASPMSLDVYLRHDQGPAVAPTLATIVALAIAHRRALRAPITMRETTDDEPRDARLFASGLAGVLATYLAALQLGIPIGPVALAGGSALLVLLVVRHDLRPSALVDEIEWGIFPFFAGLVVIVSGAERAGLIDVASAALAQLGAHALGPALVGVTTALAANAMNNLPAAVMAGAALERAQLGDPVITSAVLVGIDVGPNFTTLGSIATLLWLMQLRRRGITLRQIDYLRASVLPSAAAVGAALVTLMVLR
jgi:arsenical pump membrane protein